MKFLYLTLVLLMSGCAAPLMTPSKNQQFISAEERKATQNEAFYLRESRDFIDGKIRRAKDSPNKNEAELKEMEDQLQLLMEKLSAVEKKLEEIKAQDEAEKAAKRQSMSQGVGPRGGCYTISKSGKKNYGGC